MVSLLPSIVDISSENATAAYSFLLSIENVLKASDALRDAVLANETASLGSSVFVQDIFDTLGSLLAYDVSGRRL